MIWEVPEETLRVIAESLTLEINSSVRSCPSCDGRGYTTSEELVSYHKGEYDTRVHPCGKCSELGRVVEIKTELRGYLPRPMTNFRVGVANEFLAGTPENVKQHLAGGFRRTVRLAPEARKSLAGGG